MKLIIFCDAGTLIPSSCYEVLREALAADSDKTEENNF
jgi:hypothetical protein